ncbi:hypothetical protein [Variibacter gotjawalensis]|nr:hypothetical protein [Variibacter gotjawalensis]NIK47565.1 hypothetical protein [Variibacter gotjawalensis]
MAKQNEHGKIIAAAAKAALAPIGCVRKGQSRTWYSDERYWLILVTFDPSGWEKGTYLVVSASWLWYEKDYQSFDLGYRIADFVRFESAKQFRPIMEEYAEKAAREVERLRRDLALISDISRQLFALVPTGDWRKATGPDRRAFEAAIAAGLADDFDTARKLFDKVATWETFGYESQFQLKSKAAHIAAFVGDRHRFRAEIQRVINVQRRRFGPSEDSALVHDRDTNAQ